MVCILVNWQRHYEEEAQIVMDDDGSARLFSSMEKAAQWAVENLNWEWKVISLSKEEGVPTRQDLDAQRPEAAINH